MENVLRGVFAKQALMESMFSAPAEPAPVPAPDLGLGTMMDSVNAAESSNTGFVYTDEMRRDAVDVVQEWAESELDTGEGYGDRLYALCIGTASDGDEDLTDDESDYVAAVAELVGDYLEAKGIAADDVDALLGDELLFGNDVAARVHDALLDKLPQGDDAMMDDADNFVVGEDDTMMDATYRKVVAIRGGKKVRIRKRVAGTIRLTAGQKSAVRKMQRKAFSGAAKMKRAKSMRIRRRMLGK